MKYLLILPVLKLAVLVATAVADTVVLSDRTIECKVVSHDSAYTRIRLPSGGIMMLHTDSIRDIQYADSVPAHEPELLAPQAKDSAGVSSTVPDRALEPAAWNDVRPATPLIVAGETGAGCCGGLGLGLVASVVGAAIGVSLAGDSANFPDRVFAWIDGSNIGMLVGYAAGNALGVSLVGWTYHQGGQLWASACGAAAGALAGAAWFAVDTSSAKLSATGCVLLPMVGAILGYNLSRPKPPPTGSLLGRVEVPAVALWQSEQQTTGVNVRFVRLRF